LKRTVLKHTRDWMKPISRRICYLTLNCNEWYCPFINYENEGLAVWILFKCRTKLLILGWGLNFSFI